MRFPAPYSVKRNEMRTNMKYRAKQDFVLRDIAGELILMPRGASTTDDNYITVFNETGALLYRAMQEYTDVRTLAGLLVQQYGISGEEALADTQAYLDKMLGEGIAEAE